MRWIHPRAFTIVLLVLGLLAGCASQQASSDPSAATIAPAVPGGIEGALFSPELVLMRADAIALASEQRVQIVSAATTTQGLLDTLSARLDERTAALGRTLAASPIDEEAALAAAREVTDVESEIKLVHLRMLVQIRNVLTPEQQARLSTLRNAP